MKQKPLPVISLPTKSVTLPALKLELPPSLNHIYYTDKSGCRRLTPTARDWKEKAAWLIKFHIREHSPKRQHFNKIFCFSFLYFPDQKMRDLANYEKLLGDALTYSGVIDDDNFPIISYWGFGGDIDKDNPRLELTIIVID